MQIILLQNVNALGKVGEIKKVADGYAINFLIPHGLATMATEDKVRQIEINKQKEATKKLNEIKEIDKTINKISGKKIVIKKQASDKGKLFGAISADEIAQEINKQLGIKLDKTHIKLDEHIKEVGEREIELLANNRQVKLKIEVIGS